MVEQLREQAEKMVDLGAIPGAIQLYRRILDEHPEDADAVYMLGVLAAEQGDVALGKQFIEQSIQIEPDFPDAYYMLARLYQADEDIDQALSLGRKAVTLDRDFEDAWLLLCGLLLLRPDENGLEEACHKVLDSKPGEVRAHYGIGVSHFRKGQLEKALASLELVRKLDPEMVEGWQLGISSLRKLARYSEAESLAIDALNRFPNDVLLLNMCAEHALDRKELDVAARHLKTAAESEKLSEITRINEAWLLHERGNFEDAFKILKGVRDEHSENVAARYNLALLCKRMGRETEARAFLREAAQLVPSFEEGEQLLTVLKGKAKDDRWSNEYLKGLFDRYARGYDKHLESLTYKVPELLFNAVKGSVPETYAGVGLRALDIGCGTGLCGPYFKKICRVLDGVDLSGEMVAVARALGIYSELVVGDMLHVMGERAGRYDLIFAAGVVIYFGDLVPIFEVAHTCLPSGGLFAFDVEVADGGEEFSLGKEGRYQHRASYVSGLAKRFGFEWVEGADITSRFDAGLPVRGHVYVFRKAGGH